MALYNKDLKLLIPHTSNSNINITSHTARHTYANLLLSNGVDIYSISKSLGHSSLSVTENHVSSFNQERVDDDNTEVFRR